MVSASDIITYVGVPLTVLGVLPILWNAFKSIKILLRLRGSIPRFAKGFIELTPDLANGSVSVNADPLFFSTRAFFDPDRFRIATNYEPVMSGVSLSTRVANTFLRAHQTDSLHGTSLLKYSWMVLLTAGIPIERDRHRATQRFIVDWAMRAEEIRVQCDWESFILLALAVGADPNDPNFRLITQRKDGSFDIRTRREAQTHLGRLTMEIASQNESIFAKLSDGPLQVSWRAAYAWTLTMAFFDDDTKTLVMEPLLCYNVESDTNGFSDVATGYTLRRTQMEMENSNNLWEDALTWTLYAEEVFHEPGSELLPVPQYLLKLQEESIRDLYELHAAMNLEGNMDTIFNGNSTLKNELWRLLEEMWNELGLVVSPSVQSKEEKYGSRGTIWGQITQVPLFEVLYAKYGPRSSSRHQEPTQALQKNALMGILTRLIIAISVIRQWKREKWKTELIVVGANAGRGTIRTPPNPVVELLWPLTRQSTGVYLI